MKKVLLPVQDVNSTGAQIREWKVVSGEPVKANQIVALCETTKALFDVESPADGILIHRAALHQEVPYNSVIAVVVEAGERVEDSEKLLKPETKAPASGVKATKKAVALAESLGVALESIQVEGIISEQDVLKAAGSSEKRSGPRWLSNSEYPPGLTRVVVIGAGNGLAQVADILADDPSVRVIGCLDDNPNLGTTAPFGIPHIGKISEIKALFDKKLFDATIIAISANVALRTALFEQCRGFGIPFVNAIDRSVVIRRHSTLGVGNVICAQVHIGTYTSLGDNNFISAHCSIDHHNIWGSGVSLGPNCAFSGRVKVGDKVRFGTGVFVQNGIEIGENSIVSSGAIITNSVPAAHIVKTAVRQTLVPRTDGVGSKPSCS